jgi:hypothetical protein
MMTGRVGTPGIVSDAAMCPQPSHRRPVRSMLTVSATPGPPPNPRLARGVQPLLRPDETARHVFVAQVGHNPAWLVILPVAGIVNTLILGATSAGLTVAAVLSVAFVVWVAVAFLPMQNRVVVGTDDEVVVFDATKFRFEPKAELRRLDPSLQLGPLTGTINGRIDLGGEQAWVYRGYRATIDAIDGTLKPTGGHRLLPRQRFFGRDDLPKI